MQTHCTVTTKTPHAKRLPFGRVSACVAIAVVLGQPCGSLARGDTYSVGPGQPYSTIGSVPLAALQPGDLILIHYRPTPYREKWVIAAEGTANAPITFRGVPGPNGELPVVDGENAVTPTQLNYWSEGRGVIKVGGANTPPNVFATHIVIENLDIRGARPPAQFTDDGGQLQSYPVNAAAIFLERGEYITIRNCILRDCGNGLFVSSGDTQASRHILIEGNYIHGNGNVDRIYEHNTYTAAIDITYRFNRFGPLVAGAGGNNLKDRSAGLVVCQNWIEGGNRQLDLVDGEDSSLIRQHPDYPRTFVYGNILIEPAGAGNRQIVHYGGDSGAEEAYRKGTLYFYHNSVVSTRTDRTTLFRLSTMDEQCDARNNIIFATHAGDQIEMIDETGVLFLSHNWIRSGWQTCFDGCSGIVTDDGTQITGSDPGFADLAQQDFRPTEDSLCRDSAGPLHADVIPNHTVEHQYVKHATGEPRPVLWSGPDVGAFESPFRTLFDHNRDGRVDLDDWQWLSGCLAGPNQTPTPPPPATSEACIETNDVDLDGDVDLPDTAEFLKAYSGNP